MQGEEAGVVRMTVSGLTVTPSSDLGLKPDLSHRQLPAAFRLASESPPLPICWQSDSFSNANANGARPDA